MQSEVSLIRLGLIPRRINIIADLGKSGTVEENKTDPDSRRQRLLSIMPKFGREINGTLWFALKFSVKVAHFQWRSPLAREQALLGFSLIFCPAARAPRESSLDHTLVLFDQRDLNFCFQSYFAKL